jgi:hypothetical protein
MAAPAHKAASAVVPPPSVPDDVNPFADQKNPPKPLEFSGPSYNLDVEVYPDPETSDGASLPRMFISGPDFKWVMAPFNDWIIATRGYGESAAFVYQLDPRCRLSLALYDPKALFTAVTPANIAQYLAAMRAPDPDGFILLTPIPKNADALDGARFAGYTGQCATYAEALPNVIMAHRLWFVNMDGHYIFVATLTCPMVRLNMLDGQVTGLFGNSDIRRGPGWPSPAAPPAPAKPAVGAASGQ